MTPPRDTPEGMVADLAQVLLTLLCVHPDAAEICVPRQWVSQWYLDLEAVLGALRRAQQGGTV